jgi:hypothetical protein
LEHLLTPKQAAAVIGNVNANKVREWMRRADDPLPSVPRGDSGRFRLVIASEIDPWIKREFERGRLAAQMTSGRRRR